MVSGALLTRATKAVRGGANRHGSVGPEFTSFTRFRKSTFA